MSVRFRPPVFSRIVKKYRVAYYDFEVSRPPVETFGDDPLYRALKAGKDIYIELNIKLEAKETN